MLEGWKYKAENLYDKTIISWSWAECTMRWLGKLNYFRVRNTAGHVGECNEKGQNSIRQSDRTELENTQSVSSVWWAHSNPSTREEEAGRAEKDPSRDRWARSRPASASELVSKQKQTSTETEERIPCPNQLQTNKNIKSDKKERSRSAGGCSLSKQLTTG